MLEMMRQRIQGMVTWVIIALIAFAFIFWGLSDYFASSGKSQFAAKVNGEKISWQTVDALFERMQRQMGDQVDPKTLKDQLRTALVQRTALLSSAKHLGFRVGDVQVAQTLIQVPVFQVEGKFSKDRYLQVLQEAAYTDQGFRQELAQDVLLGQLEQGLALSSFSLGSEVRRLVELVDQQRNVGFASIPMQKFKPAMQISNEEIKAYFDSHQSTFVVPEQLALEYVELSIDELAKQLDVSNEDEIKAYYTEHKASYGSPERVHARHILIPVAEKNKEADSKAKAQAENLMTQLKSGANFADLAKENSSDSASAKKGGDLGWFTKGQMIPEFEKAAFGAQKPNELAGPIRTTFGYHIIQVLEHKTAEIRPLAEVKSLVKEQLQREKAQFIFVEKGEQLAKLAYEQSNSLTPIAEQLGTKIQETELFGRQGGSGPLSGHPEVIRSAFAEGVLKQGSNSEPLKLNDTSIAVIRLKKHVPAKQQTLQEVEKQIKDRLVAEAAIKKAKEMAELMIQKIRAGEDPVKLAKDNDFTWTVKKNLSRNATDMDRNIVTAIFQTPHPDGSKPGLKSLGLPNGDSLVIAVNDIHEGELSKVDEETRQNYRQSLADVMGQLEFTLYATRVINQAKIEMSEQLKAE